MISEAKFSHYKLHIAKIDKAHWEIVNHVNKILQNGQVNRCYVCHLQKILQELPYQLEYEELLMEKLQFPFRFHHKKQHELLLNDLSKTIDFCLDDSTLFNKWTISSISQRFIAHIDQHDIQLSQFITDKKHERQEKHYCSGNA